MWDDVRYAVRGLRKSPGFTALAVGALALGMGANCAIFSVIHAVLFSPLPYADSAHLYEIGTVDTRGNITGTSLADFVALRERGGVFEQLSVDRFFSATLTDHLGDAERIYGRALSAGTFPVLKVTPALGRVFTNEDYRSDAPRVALLSERLWRRRYSGDANVIGRTIELDNESYTVVGIMPARFQFPISAYDIWTPWTFSAQELANRRGGGSIIYTRLHPGATLPQAQSELDAFAHAMAIQFPETGQNWHPRIGPTKLGDADRYRTQLMVLLGAVGFVLLIACLNVANLLLARAAGRRREMAVRIALGAGRWRIARQLLTESLLLAVAGGAMGLVLASWGARILMTSFPVRAPLSPFDAPGVDLTLVGFAFAVAMLTGLAFGLAPAIQLSRPDLNPTLKESSSAGGWRRFSFRGMLIVAETALSIILLAGAGLMIRSFSRLMEVHPGFHPENTLIVQVPMPSFLEAITSLNARKDIEARQAAQYGELVVHIRALPGVTAAAMGSVQPLGAMEAHTRVGFEGDPNPKQDHGAQLRSVSTDYFRAMGIALLKGRTFTEADSAGAPEVAIVNDVLARRYWPQEDPIGKRVNMSGLPSGPWLEVVGMTAGIRQRQLSDQPEPEIYRPYRQYLGPAFGAVLAVRSTRDPSALAPAIRQIIRTKYPGQPIGEIRLMTDLVAESVGAPRFYTALLAIFAALAVLLASAGIYGIMSYSVAQRTKEVGIRMALGASRGRVLKLVLGEGLILALAGVVIGAAGAAALTRLIREQLYETSATDPGTFLAVSFALLVVALAAGYVPASRAANVDPMVALREE